LLLSVAQERSAWANPVIPSGQEAEVAELLGRGVTFPDECVWNGSSIASDRISTEYRCRSGTYRLSLMHPSAASTTPWRTAKFAVVETPPSPPPEFMQALVSRIRAEEVRFRWLEPEPARTVASPQAVRTRAWPQSVAALATAAVALVAFLIWQRRQPARPKRPAPPVRPWLAFAAAFALPWLFGYAIRFAAEAAAAGYLDRSPRVYALRVFAFLAIVVGATLPASIVARAPSRKGVVAAMALAALLWCGIGYTRSLGRAPKPQFEGLYSRRPNAHWEDRRGKPEVVSHIETNELGFRGPSFVRERTPGVPRIVLLGDSNVFGLGVNLDGTLGVQLQQAVQQRLPKRNVEVLNLGVPGSNLAAHVTFYEAASRVLNPDVVVMCVSIPNDLSNWDYQAEAAASSRLGAYSLARFALGEAGPVIFNLLYLEDALTPRGLAHLAQQTERLRQLRSGAGSPPLVLFAYHRVGDELTATLGQLPGTKLLGSGDPQPGDSIPQDGHPTSKGNRRCAEIIADALANEPSILAAMQH
jgi:lysophospholipase L1-like esterase